MPNFGAKKLIAGYEISSGFTVIIVDMESACAVGTQCTAHFVTTSNTANSALSTSLYLKMTTMMVIIH
jgi:hypothetical protein